MRSGCTSSSLLAMASHRQPSFPAELLTEIFLWAWVIQNKNDFWNEKRVEVALSQVSRAWRDLTLHHPILWTTLVVTIPGPLALHSNLQLYLDRSKKLPLDVRFAYIPEWLEETEKILDILRTQVDRWHSFSVSTSNREFLLFFDDYMTEIHAPALERYNVFLHNNPPEYSNNTLFESGAPILKEIGLHGISLNRSKPPLGAVKRLTLAGGHNWDTRLEGDDVEYQLMDYLLELRSMEELYLYNRAIQFRWAEPEWTPERTITVSSLRKLAIIQDDGDYYDYDPVCIFQSMRLPALLELHIVGMMDLGATFQLVAEHSNPPRLPSVQLLDMRPVEADDITVESHLGFIRQLDGVKHLVANHVYLEMLGTAMDEGSTSRVDLWSKLETLTYDSMTQPPQTPQDLQLAVEEAIEGVEAELSALSVDTKRLCIFVEKRAQIGCPLKLVRLSEDFMAKNEAIEWLKKRATVEAYPDSDIIRYKDMVPDLDDD